MTTIDRGEDRDFLPFRLRGQRDIEEIGLKLIGHAASPKGVDLVTVDGRDNQPVPHHTTSTGYFFHTFILQPKGSMTLDFGAAEPLSRMSFFPENMPTIWEVGPFVAAMCHFSSDFIADAAATEPGLRVVEARCAMGNGSPQLNYLGQLMFTESRAPGFGARLLSEAFGLEILVEIARFDGRSGLDGAPARGGLPPWQMRRLTDYVQAHLSDDLSLQTLAGLLGMSSRHLARVVRRETGVSVHRWVAALRLAEAKRLLACTRLPLREIAQRTAFSSPAAFSAAFRDAMGLSPSDYRKLVVV